MEWEATFQHRYESSLAKKSEWDLVSIKTNNNSVKFHPFFSGHECTTFLSITIYLLCEISYSLSLRLNKSDEWARNIRWHVNGHKKRLTQCILFAQGLQLTRSRSRQCHCRQPSEDFNVLLNCSLKPVFQGA